MPCRNRGHCPNRSWRGTGTNPQKMTLSTETTRKETDEDAVAWYAMRDLKRPNAIEPAYKMLQRNGFEVFTPMRQKLIQRGRLRLRTEMPVVQDLLFVHSTKRRIDQAAAKCPTLQHRYMKGRAYKEPTIIREEDMRRFITAVNSAPSPHYYAADEVAPGMTGHTVRICGGALDGITAPLLRTRGSRKKRVFVAIPGFIAASVELTGFDYIEIIL